MTNQIQQQELIQTMNFQPPTSAIVFHIASTEYIKITDEGFFVKGKPVQAGQDEAREVYEAMKELLRGHGLLKQWQTISTAPRDGTFILMYDPDFGHPKTGTGDAKGFYFFGDDDRYYFAPKYWMPLPTPPKE